MQKAHASQIRKLMEDEKFDSLLLFYKEYVDRVREQNVIGETSDETLKLTYMREGSIKGIENFFNQLEQSANG